MMHCCLSNMKSGGWILWWLWPAFVQHKGLDWVKRNGFLSAAVFIPRLRLQGSTWRHSVQIWNRVVRAGDWGHGCSNLERGSVYVRQETEGQPGLPAINNTHMSANVSLVGNRVRGWKIRPLWFGVSFYCRSLPLCLMECSRMASVCLSLKVFWGS